MRAVVLILMSVQGLHALTMHKPEVKNSKNLVVGKAEDLFEMVVPFPQDELSPAEFVTMTKNHKPSKDLSMSKKPKRPLVFVHVHKSLGTWACKVAKLNNAVTPKGPDCNTHEDGPWHTKEFEYFDNHNTCAARNSLNDANGYTFEEIERHVDFQSEKGGDICPNEMYSAVIFRRPIDRIKSQMMANKASYTMVSGYIQEGSKQTSPHGFIYSHIPYDNFYIRTFLGRDFFKSAGKITRADLERAKKNLAKIDVVIDVEDLMTQVVQLELYTGWQIPLHLTAQQVHNDGCWRGGEECHQYELSEAAEEELTRRNLLDEEFYQYAKELAAQKTAALG